VRNSVLPAKPPRWPLLTISIVVITGIFTSVQFIYPPLLFALRRTPGALSQHEWWRLITPILVHDGGWRQIAFNFPATLIAGAIVERFYTRGEWLGLYLLGAVVGELAGFAWQPDGAGNSVAGAGLLGGIAVWLLCLKLMPARVGASILLGGALVLTLLRDLHGPPLLAGACAGAILLRRRM